MEETAEKGKKGASKKDAPKKDTPKTILLTPTDEHPIPYADADEEVTTFMDEVAVAGNTAELLNDLSPIEVDKDTAQAEAELLKTALATQDSQPLTRLPVAYAAAHFMKTYGGRLGSEMSEVRQALTNKLLEIADCGEPRYELKAIELLGKHSDIGLFTERSEINVNYNTSESLEAAIKARVKRLLDAEVVEVAPEHLLSLDEELGSFVAKEPEEAEYVEVEKEQSDG